MLKIDKPTARRFLLKKQKLWPEEEQFKESKIDASQVLQMIKSLECVQIDPVAVVEKNQHLTLAARMPGYHPDHLNELLSGHKVFEYKANEACVIPIEDYPIFKPIRMRMHDALDERIKALGPVVDHVVDRLKKEGPLPSRAFKSEVKVHGYWDNKAPSTKKTSHALNLLMDTGEIRVVERIGSDRIFGITEDTVPKEIWEKADAISVYEASQALIEKFINAYGIFDSSDLRFGWQRMKAADRKIEIENRVSRGELVPIEVEGVKRSYFIRAEDVDLLESAASPLPPEDGPIRFLPPLDNLLWRRERLEDFFDFSYRWEIYIPKEKRQYGAYTMPILAGDQLIGRVDPRVDRETKTLVIQLFELQPGVKNTKALQKSIDRALHRFAEFLGARNVRFEIGKKWHN
ncbi:winged helix-turn-helix domain-containing protein [Bacillus litorisediminis]|uniref:winged helix-turn-helix domain-containing protein n=1 Tax=Bacillus litorisediminis TaxID=2922713 RepID=UPI001FAF09D1|nr:crosslink repair DNA glycosylase YcaQ family protein [Bacillus litorisediminis]